MVEPTFTDTLRYLCIVKETRFYLYYTFSSDKTTTLDSSFSARVMV